MKKLLAFLTACTAMSCIFASCGDKEEESTVSSESSVSAEETTEEVAKEETTEVSEEETEEETPAEESQEETVPETVPETSSETAGNASSEQSFLIGKWQCEKVVEDGKESDMIDEYIPAYMIQLDFKDDGTVLLGEFAAKFIVDESQNCTWTMTVPDNIIKIEDKYAFVYEDNYLVCGDDNEKVYLSKVDEFKTFGDFDPSAFIGKWEGEKSIIDGEETDIDGDDMPVSVYQFDLKEDNKVGIGEYVAEFYDEENCFWYLLSNNQAVLFLDGDKIISDIEGDNLVIADEYDEENKIYLKRVDEFQSVSELIS